jgi:hypothetical protein
MTMTNEQIAALDALLKGLGTQEAKGALVPGSHEVDFTIRVSGSLTKGEDTVKKPTSSIPWLTTLALFVHRSGIQRDLAMAILRDTMTEALNLDKDAERELLRVSGVADAKELFEAEVTSKLPRTPVQGAVKGKVAYEIV